MADFEFVIEAPQVARPNKKRPRLVTSCDHCRVKKIKCVQQPSTGTCEACMTANLPCLYRDREQYFAERTRMLSGVGSALRDASTDAHSRAQLSAINASTPMTSRGPSPPRSSGLSSGSSTAYDRSSSPSHYSSAVYDPPDVNPFMFSPYSSGFNSSSERPTWESTMQPLSWSSRCHSHSPSITSMETAIPSVVLQISPLLGLFDPTDQHQPHPNLMINFLHVFFEKLGSSYPFLSSDMIHERFLHRQLSPLLANCIAASAARLSTVPEIMQVGPANAADVYCQYAKRLVPPENTPATLDTVHALMLLAWAEYKRGRLPMFNAYARTVTRLASELGISDESIPMLTRISDAQAARMLTATWHGIQLIDRTVLASELVAFSGGDSPPHSMPQQRYIDAHTRPQNAAIPFITSLW